MKVIQQWSELLATLAEFAPGCVGKRPGDVLVTASAPSSPEHEALLPELANRRVTLIAPSGRMHRLLAADEVKGQSAFLRDLYHGMDREWPMTDVPFGESTESVRDLLLVDASSGAVFEYQTDTEWRSAVAPSIADYFGWHVRGLREGDIAIVASDEPTESDALMLLENLATDAELLELFGGALREGPATKRLDNLAAPIVDRLVSSGRLEGETGTLEPRTRTLFGLLAIADEDARAAYACDLLDALETDPAIEEVYCDEDELAAAAGAR